MNNSSEVHEKLPYANILNNFWELMDETVNQFPEKIFVITQHGTLTFRDVIHHANNLGNLLSSHILHRNFGVGIFLKDPLKIIPSMIGIIKAGGYLVVLDTGHPEETLRSIIENAEIQLIITDSDLESIIHKAVGSNVTLINYDNIDFSQRINFKAVHYQPEDWIQILYTSGSTGNPKGAIETYRFLAYAIYIRKTAHRFDSTNRILQVSNFTFSAAHMTLFGALFTGASICFYNIKEDGFANLAIALRSHKISHFNATVTVFRTWMETLGPDEKFPLITYAHVGAEKRSHKDLAKIKSHFPNVKSLRLGFASTETQSISSDTFPIDVDFGEGDIPCGRPNEGMQVFIWDENGNNLPIGEEGEFVVYSDALARGYINNPELTKERFLPDPENPIFQYYKTGDLGKIREDGQLVHLGRIDNMVKIKGVRIELESIEKHMLTYPGVLQTTFRVFEDSRGNKRLTAYFKAEAGVQIPISDLRKFLSNRLPAHQHPHFFVQLEQFPFTRTGKLDKNQLPHPAMTRPALSNPYVAPITELETTLVRIWEDEIGVLDIGVTDDFFEIGGDSLIGVVLFIRIEKELGRNLPVSTLLTASTIRSQAEVINNQSSLKDFSPLIAIRDQGSLPPLFFIPGKGGYPTRIHHLAKLVDTNLPIYALQNLWKNPGYKNFRSIESIAKFYWNEIKKIRPYGPYFLVGESMGGKISYEIAQLMTKQGDEILILALLDTYNFELTDSARNKSTYYRMLIKKHLTIIFRSNWQGKLEYLNFYRETFREKMLGWLKRRLNNTGKRFTKMNKNLNAIEKDNIKAAQRYSPAPYQGRVILFKALRGPNAKHPANGWDKVQLGELVIHPLDCYHGSILFEPAVSELARVLNGYIADTEDKKTS